MFNYLSKAHYNVIESESIIFYHTSLSKDKYKKHFTQSINYITNLKTIFVSDFTIVPFQSYIEIKIAGRNPERFYLHNARLHLPSMEYLKIFIDIYIDLLVWYDITLYGIPEGKKVIIAGDLLQRNIP